MATKEYIKTFKDEVNRLLVEQEYQKRKAEIDTAFQQDISAVDNSYQQALYNLEVNKNNYLNSYDYFLPENNYHLPNFGSDLQSSTYSGPLNNLYSPNNLTVDYINFPISPVENVLSDESEVSLDEEIDLPDLSFSFKPEDQNDEVINTPNESGKEEESKITDVPLPANLLSSLSFNETEGESSDESELASSDEELPDNTNEISLLTALSNPAQVDTAALSETALSNMPDALVNTAQTPVQNTLQTPVPQAQIPVQATSSAIQQPNTLQTLSGISQPTTFYKTDLLPQQKADEKTAAFAHEQQKNMIVRAAEWVQENIFDAVGDHVPLIGTVIKMIGNVFTGFFKTIGNLFDGNFGNALSSGLSWLKDSAIIGGSAYGIYKLGKEFNWWGKKKSATSSLITQNTVENTVQNMVQDAVVNAVTQNMATTGQSIISGVATPVSENASTDVLQNLMIGKLNQYNK